jgi:uncharacterized membrane protein (GlpM family)
LPQTLVLQLITSFLVGGAAVTLLSLLAEKANDKIAGIILIFPTTIVLGLLFLGISTSAQTVAFIIPATLIPLGLAVFLPVIYIYTAMLFNKIIMQKSIQILATLISTCIVWFGLAIPFVIYKFNNLLTGILGFLCLSALGHIILNRPVNNVVINKAAYSRKQILFRAIFIGTVVALVVYLSKILNSFWGGLFAVFPAATTAALLIFHYYYTPQQLIYFMRKAPMGALSVFCYALMVLIFYPKFGLALGTVVSYSISLALSLIMIKLQQSKK